MSKGIRVLSWNLMHTLEASRISKFYYCKPNYLASASRLDLMANIVQKSGAKIACFQELDAIILPKLQGVLQESLTEAVVKLNSNLPSKDGVGIFVDSKAYEVLDVRTVRLGSVLDVHLPSLSQNARSDTSPASLTRALYREVREKMNQVAMVRLRDVRRQGVGEFVVCSTHLFWDPAYPDIKLIQSYLMAKEAEKFANGCPLVIGGDLNSLPYSSGVYELLLGEGTVDSSHIHHPVSLRGNRVNSMLKPVVEEDISSLSIGIPFKSAYASINGKEPEFTNYTSGFKGCLDYIMFRNFVAKSVEALPLESDLSSETALPNKYWPSDHLPLIADLDYS